MKSTQITLQDLLHAINILGDDRDICVDGYDTLAVCPPVKFTPAGREHFKRALSANVVVEYKNDSHRQTYVSDSDEDIDRMAYNLLLSLAGYCCDDDFKVWFEGDTAELI